MNKINNLNIYIGANVLLLAIMFLIYVVSPQQPQALSIAYSALIYSLPVLLMVKLYIAAFSRTKKSQQLYSSHPTVARLLSAFAGIALGSSLLCNNYADSLDQFTQQKYVYQNAGVAGLAISAILILLVCGLQKSLYVPFLSKLNRMSMDERQTFVRQRVFEKSYRYVIVLILIGSLLFDFDSGRMSTFSPFYVLIITLGLPAMVASWQKDS